MSLVVTCCSLTSSAVEFDHLVSVVAEFEFISDFAIVVDELVLVIATEMCGFENIAEILGSASAGITEADCGLDVTGLMNFVGGIRLNWLVAEFLPEIEFLVLLIFDPSTPRIGLICKDGGNSMFPSENLVSCVFGAAGF